jgi:hypothetical protein
MEPGSDPTASCYCRADRLGCRRGAVGKCVLVGPGEFAEITGDGNVAIRPETRDYLTWEVYHAQGMPCVLEVRKSSRLGTGVILLG